jgi:hypothetical protein
LNSGLANSSGVMGHYLHDQIYGVSVVASVPEARDGKAPQGLMGGNVFIPRFRNLTKEDKRGFIKGYCMLINSGGGANPNFFAAYGDELQKKLDSYAGSCISGSIYGERVARFENHVRINKGVTDAWGIPVVHVDVRDSDNELNMAKDAADKICSRRRDGKSSRRRTNFIRPVTAFMRLARAAWAIIRRPAF